MRRIPVVIGVALGACGIARAGTTVRVEQGLRVEFDADAVRFSPAAVRDDESAAFRWSMRCVSFGRAGDETVAASAAPAVTADRIEYRRGALTEWYVADARGFEQGFTLDARPSGSGALVVTLATEGTLAATLRGDGLDFVALSGAWALRYDRLAAEDARGRALPARMRLVAGGVVLEVDDAGAVYPVTIDPLATNASWTANGSQAAGYFGYSTATAGDVNADGFSDVIVGSDLFDNAHTNEGAAFVYLGSPTGLGASPAWSAYGGQANAHFGNSVSTAGDVNGDGYSDVIVGAPAFDNGQTDEGRAFVFHGSPAGLGANPAWTAEGNQLGVHFGGSVATLGDVNGNGFSDVIVGAPLFSNGQTTEGAAYVFLGSGSGLAPTPAWSDESNQAGAELGSQVAFAGDVDADGFDDAVAGAPFFDSPQVDSGSATVYRGTSGIGVLVFATTLLGPAPQAGANFGISVATAGDVDHDGQSDLIVGADGYNSGDGRATLFTAWNGIAFVFWTVDGAPLSGLGHSVATAGDADGDGLADVAIGSPDSGPVIANEGSAAVYSGPIDSQGAPFSWSVAGGQANGHFGECVATAGDVDGDGLSDLLVGASRYNNTVGRVTLYSGGTWTATNDIGELTGNQANGEFGSSIASAGDVNGDGYSDTLVGWRYFDNGQSDEGAAELFVGANTISSTAQWIIEGGQVDADLGVAVASAGDVNGDGRSDVIVGADGAANGLKPGAGRASIFLGSGATLAPTAAWSTTGGAAFDALGAAVASAGDVDGDGYGDVLVGAPGFEQGQTDEGSASLYRGGASGVATVAAWTAEGNQSAAAFGAALAGAGDVNADGFSDVIVGAPAFDNGQTDEGKAFVYLGSAFGLAASATWVAESNAATATFGIAVASAGDVNADGFSDVIVGARDLDNGQIDEGRAYLYLGSASGPSASAAWSPESDIAGARFGCAVAGAGDVNEDGSSDVLVGSSGELLGGAASLYLGSPTGLATSAVWKGTGGFNDAHFGSALSAAGDLNGDGFADFTVSGPRTTGDAGRIWFFDDAGYHYFSAPVTPCHQPMLRQRRADDSAPIAPLGRTITGSFLAKAFVGSPFGRCRAQLGVETKPLGAAFDGSGVVKSTAADTGKLGVEQGVVKSGLAANTNWRWRARAIFSPVTSPFLPAGPWVTPAANGLTETDFRTDVCGGLLASASTYGSGKSAGGGPPPALATSVAPAKGATADVTLTGGLPGATGVLLLAGLAPVSQPFDLGTLLVQPNYLVPLPPLDAQGGFSVPIFVAVPVCGLNLYFQAMFSAPGAPGYYHTAQTNGVHWVIGS